MDLVSHITYVVYVNFLYKSGGTFSFKSIPNDQFFFLWNFPLQIHLLF